MFGIARTDHDYQYLNGYHSLGSIGPGSGHVVVHNLQYNKAVSLDVAVSVW